MNSGLSEIGKWLVLAGLGLALAGGLLWLSGRFPNLGLGKLPGDIAIKRENFTFYFPLGTGLLLSAVLTLIIWLIRWFTRR